MTGQHLYVKADKLLNHLAYHRLYNLESSPSGAFTAQGLRYAIEDCELEIIKCQDRLKHLSDLKKALEEAIA